MKKLFFVIFLGLFTTVVAVAEAPAGGGRSTAIITSSDTSGYNLSSALQYAVAQMFKETGEFNAQASSFALPGFTPEQTKKAHEVLSSEVFSFAYMDRERISIFLFDSTRPGEYIVAVNPLLDTPEQALTTPLLETKLRKTFNDVIAAYRAKSFQFLPGAGPTTRPETEKVDAHRQSAELGHLFKELATISEKPLYMGASIGMARYSNAGTAENLVSIGLYGGYRLFSKMAVEASLDLFNYGLFSLDLRYAIPLSGKYLSLYLSAGAGMVLLKVTDNLGYGNTTLPLGAIVFGPGFSFDIPMLGANIRGSVRYYLGRAQILMGAYGVSYYLSL